MGIDIFKWIRGQENKGVQRVSCEQMFEDCATELQVRLLSWDICVNMIANAIGRCEFRTYSNGEEKPDGEYYLWNYEPNANENSTMFLHKLIYRLYLSNEALVIEDGKRKAPGLIVADGFDPVDYYPNKQNEYKGVVVGEQKYAKTFRESDVLHLKLHHANVKPVLDGIVNNYATLASMSADFIKWSQGHHWKVHVDQTMQGEENWQQNFMNMLTNQLKPFLNGNAAVLPEFDGYTYSDVRAERVYQSANGETATLKNLTEEIFNFTARTLMIPVVLVNGQLETTGDANKRFLTNVIDPLCDQLQEEIVRKRYGFEQWSAGNYLRVDSSSITHFDLFDAASGIEKLVGSGAFTINDIRKAAGQAPINEPWANKYFMTKNISGIESAVALEA